DPEVEDDEVPVVVDAFDPAEQLVDDHVEAGLLDDLAHHRGLDGLPPLDSPAGDGPPPRRRAVPAPDEEQLVVADGDRADGQLRPGHGSKLRGRCMTSSRAVRPCSSKKFFAARCPGSARASTPTQRCSAAKAMSASAMISPTPTERASVSTNSSVIRARRSPFGSVSSSTTPNPTTTSSMRPATTR